MRKTTIQTDQAPAAIGPYSQAVRVDNTLYLSGQVALDPSTGEFCNADFETEVRQILANMRAVLAAANSDFSHIVKLTIYLIDFSDFPSLNYLLTDALPTPYPARSTVAVAALPKGARVEIEAIACL